jgi:hypothetical protein
LSGCQNPTKKLSSLEEYSQLRIIVGGEGYFQIPFMELAEKGLRMDDSIELSLYYSGRLHPYWIYDDPIINEQSIRFYSPTPGNNLSENVFTLSTIDANPYNQIIPTTTSSSFSNSQGSSSGLFNIHEEQQSLYLPQITGEDRWVWTQLLPDQLFDFSFNVPKPAIDDISIKFHLWSPITNIQYLDPSISISINDCEPISLTWEGDGWGTVEYAFDSNYLSDLNLLHIQSSSFVDEIPQKIFLDWIEIQYSNSIKLSEEIQSFTLKETGSVNQTVLIDGTLIVQTPDFKVVDIYHLKKGQLIYFQGNHGNLFTWIPEGQFLPVSSIQPIPEAPNVFPVQPIDYLVIAPQPFQQSLRPLLSLREKQGMQTFIISPQQIYDHLNSGFPSPMIIRDYINELTKRYPDRLQYLLLVGDYSYEILNYQQSIELLPSFFIDTSIGGQTISDFPFADLNGDSLPDLAVGRIPASTKQDVSIWVDKLLLYEENIPKEWQKIIAISDPQDEIFADSAQILIQKLQDQYRTQLINFSTDSTKSSSLLEAFRESYSLLVYFGHGGIDLWGKDRLISTRDLKELPSSNAPPVIFSFSCLNGYFIHPEKTSLTEQLLFNPDGGAVALLAPTSLTLHESQVNFLLQIIFELQLRNTDRFGNLIRSSIMDINQRNSQILDVVNTFLIFGDPAMLLPITILENE